MPIQYQKPPIESLTALRGAIQSMPRAYSADARMMSEVSSQPDEHWPHPVYRVGLKDLVASNGLRKAEIIGWRYLAHSGSNRNYAVEVQVDEDEAEHFFSELDKGPYIDGIYRVLNDPVLARQLGKAKYKLAVLRINAMGIFAVWLKAEQSEQDLLIPLPPAPRYLTPWQTYSTKHFQDVLKTEAKNKLALEFSDA